VTPCLEQSSPTTQYFVLAQQEPRTIAFKNNELRLNQVAIAQSVAHSIKNGFRGCLVPVRPNQSRWRPKRKWVAHAAGVRLGALLERYGFNPCAPDEFGVVYWRSEWNGAVISVVDGIWEASDGQRVKRGTSGRASAARLERLLAAAKK